MRSVELVKELGFSNKAVPRSAAGAEGRVWLLFWFLQEFKHTHNASEREEEERYTDFNSKRTACYRFLGWYTLAVKGAVADLKVGDPAKPLMNPGLVNGLT